MFWFSFFFFFLIFFLLFDLLIVGLFVCCCELLEWFFLKLFFFFLVRMVKQSLMLQKIRKLLNWLSNWRFYFSSFFHFIFCWVWMNEIIFFLGVAGTNNQTCPKKKRKLSFFFFLQMVDLMNLLRSWICSGCGTWTRTEEEEEEEE